MRSFSIQRPCSSAAALHYRVKNLNMAFTVFTVRSPSRSHGTSAEESLTDFQHTAAEETGFGLGVKMAVL
ncbi:uncharacterized [Tachysurus ichikawai]